MPPGRLILPSTACVIGSSECFPLTAVCNDRAVPGSLCLLVLHTSPDSAEANVLVNAAAVMPEPDYTQGPNFLTAPAATYDAG